MGAFFTTIINFFIGGSAFIGCFFDMVNKKSGGVSKILIPIQVTAVITYIAFILISVTFFLNFLFTVWTKFKDLINDFNTLGVSVGGSSYGISNAQLVSSFWGLIHESGLDDALITRLDCLSLLLRLILLFQAYKIVRFAYKELYTILVDLIRNTLI